MKKYLLALLISSCSIVALSAQENKELTVKTISSDSGQRISEEEKQKSEIQLKQLEELLKNGWKVVRTETKEEGNYIIITYFLIK